MSETNPQFKIQINFTKAYKDAEGNAFIEGIASGPEVDLTGERMSPQALQSMVDSISKRIIEFRDAHKEEWNDDLGEVIELSLTDDNHLFYKAKLDLNLSAAQDLWYRITKKDKKYGVSIGGGIVKAGWEYVAELGREIFTYFDVALYEISITRQAAYQYSFANAVTKSLPRKEEPMPQPNAVEKTDELEPQANAEVAEQTQPDTNLTESTAAAPADATEEAQETTESPAEGEEATQDDADEAAAKADAEPEESEEAESTEEVAEPSTDADASAEESAPEAAPETDHAEAAGETSDQGDEVTKSAIFGEFAHADVAAVSVRSLTEELSWTVWSTVYTSDEDERTPEERKAYIAQALSEYSAIVQTVCDALIDNGTTAEAEKTFVVPRSEAVAKSLDEREARVAELTKSLADTTTELETARKSLEEKTKELSDATTQLETIKARKGLVFDKFGSAAHEADAADTAIGSPTLNRWLNS